MSEQEGRLMSIARYLDRVHLPDTVGAALAAILVLYLLGHVVLLLLRGPA